MGAHQSSLEQGTSSLLSVYAQQVDRPEKPLDRWARTHLGFLWRLVTLRNTRFWHSVGHASELRGMARRMDDRSLCDRLASLAPKVWSEGRKVEPQHLGEALALVREIAFRSVGLEPYDTQILGASMLATGHLVEMATGEGKTLTAALAALLVASAGVPVHVVTVNDYLAERDAREMGPLFAFLGLRVGSVVGGRSHEVRRQAYECNVTYCTGKELVFDYLKDRVVSGSDASGARLKLRNLLGGTVQPLLLKGLHFVIVDEADSILVDEARTPLILSEPARSTEEPREIYRQALDLVSTLRRGEHFDLRSAQREVTLTIEGRHRLRDRAAGLGTHWAVLHAREQWALQALRALHLFRRGHEYVIKDGKVLIVDDNTGRVLPGRTWEQGLHQMIECKEACELSPSNRTVARITCQRFYRRYLRLSGMTGTGREVRREIWRDYHLWTHAVPTHRPVRRVVHPTRCAPDASTKWQWVVDEVQRVVACGRPVLIGTRSVHASEALSGVLTARGVQHRVLNAIQDSREAELVASAGMAGMVTVATDMAGRGTDIKLQPAVIAAGGLHVIMTEFHESGRVDRQLFGRAARQGDPGSALTIVSLDDPLLRLHLPRLVRRIASIAIWSSSSWLINLMGACAQLLAERVHARSRSVSIEHDERIETLLSFSGRS